MCSWIFQAEARKLHVLPDVARDGALIPITEDLVESRASEIQQTSEAIGQAKIECTRLRERARLSTRKTGPQLRPRGVLCLLAAANASRVWESRIQWEESHQHANATTPTDAARPSQRLATGPGSRTDRSGSSGA